MLSVGSDPGSAIELSGGGVSPEQFVVIEENGEIVLINRADGTKLNGTGIKPGARRSLKPGDEISVGAYVVELDTSPGAVEEAPKANAEFSGEPERARVAAVGSASGSEDIVKGNAESSETGKGKKEHKDFSKVLTELRDEDTFYFHLSDEDGVTERVPFVDEQVWIGTKLGSVTIAPEESELDEVFCRANKDWSGVVVYPSTEQSSLLNGEKLAKPERLKNEDKLVLVDDFDSAEIDISISFHEPVSLLALSSILPEELPEPVSESKEARPLSKRPRGAGHARGITDGAPRLIFGYYTMLELLVMAFGTIVTAAIIFFVLELV